MVTAIKGPSPEAEGVVHAKNPFIPWKMTMRTRLAPIALLASLLAVATAPAHSASHQLPPMPEAVASFGAATDGEFVYVYGGHIGRAHQHSFDNLAGGFRRLKIDGGTRWEELPFGPKLQGLALEPYDGKLYRIGGLSARNPKGEDEDLWSVDSVARFDPESRTWEKLTPLPEPRSSHNAFVAEGKLYVVGGWQLRGKDLDPVWPNHGWVADLTQPTIAWEKLPEQDFLRRAAAVVATPDKVYLIGGISDDRTSGEVEVLDLASGAWMDGPDVPVEGGLKGFGASAFVVDGEIFMLPSNGILYRLSDDESAWVSTDLTLHQPRFFHRLLPFDDGRLVAFGGASRAGHHDDVELVDLKGGEVLAAANVVKSDRKAPAAMWTSYRNAGDSTLDSDFPARAGEDVAWRVPIPGYGQSTPIVWRDRTYVTSVDGEQKQTLVVSALDVDTGSVIWRRRFPATQRTTNDDMVSRAAPTPTVVGDRLVVFFESGDLFGLDHDGNVEWRRSLTREFGFVQGNHGLASSVVPATDGVILAVHHAGPSYLMKFDARSGETAWKIDRPNQPSWSTPLVTTHDDVEQVIVSASGRVDAYDSETGESLWFVTGLERNNVPSPIRVGERIVVTASTAGSTMAIELGGSGDVTESHVAWRPEGVTSSFASPVHDGGCIFIVNRPGVAHCVDAASGEVRWQHRLGGGVWATPVVTPGGTTFVTTEGEITRLPGAERAPKDIVTSQLDVAEGQRVYGVAAAGDFALVRTGDALIRLGGAGRSGALTASGDAD